MMEIISEIIKSLFIMSVICWTVYFYKKLNKLEEKQKEDNASLEERFDSMVQRYVNLRSDVYDWFKVKLKPCEGEEKEPELEEAKKVFAIDTVKKLNKWCNEHGYFLRFSTDGKGFDVAIFKKTNGFNYLMCRTYLEDDYAEALDVRYQEIINGLL